MRGGIQILNFDDLLGKNFFIENNLSIENNSFLPFSVWCMWKMIWLGRDVVRNLNSWVHRTCFLNFQRELLGFLSVLSKNLLVHRHLRNPRQIRPCYEAFFKSEGLFENTIYAKYVVAFQSAISMVFSEFFFIVINLSSEYVKINDSTQGAFEGFS